MRKGNASLAFLFLFFAFSDAAHAFTEDLLDRRTYAVELTKAQEASGIPDTLSFQKGQFMSEFSAGHGYEKADYKATVTSGIITFSAQIASKEGGIQTWSGTITSREIVGVMSAVEKVKEKIKEKGKEKEVEKIKTSEFSFKGSQQ